MYHAATKGDRCRKRRQHYSTCIPVNATLTTTVAAAAASVGNLRSVQSLVVMPPAVLVLATATATRPPPISCAAFIGSGDSGRVRSRYRPLPATTVVPRVVQGIAINGKYGGRPARYCVSDGGGDRASPSHRYCLYRKLGIYICGEGRSVVYGRCTCLRYALIRYSGQSRGVKQDVLLHAVSYHWFLFTLFFMRVLSTVLWFKHGVSPVAHQPFQHPQPVAKLHNPVDDGDVVDDEDLA